jgi:WD40 repeat protein/tRNA A-37 threonylcarbamoyl transferase component Bud32
MDSRTPMPAKPPATLDDILLAYLKAVEAGQTPDRAALLARHPHLADDLAAFFTDQDRLAPLVDPLRTGRPAAVPTSFGDYEVLEELGKGGMGVVYKARQVKLDRVVALKMIRSAGLTNTEERARFEVEARAVARLQHPNIVQVFEVGAHQETPFLALEFVAGGNLADQIRGVPWEARRAAELVQRLARAVHHAHENGVVHRDLKPANVLLSATGEPKVSDFGLAKRIDTDADLTRSGMIVGTPSYMAPEQASGKGKQVGPAADVWALGAILYELLTGRSPFGGATVADTLVQVQLSEPVPPSRLIARLPRDLETICLKCLEKHPRQRYGKAADVAEDLGRFLEGRTITARPVGALARGWRWCRRNRAVAALAASVFALLVLAALSAATAALQYRAKADAESKARLDLEEQQRVLAEQNRVLEEQRQVLEEQLYDNSIAVAERELTLNHDVGLASKLLERCPQRLRGWEWHYLMRLRDGNPPPLKGHKAGVWMAAFSPDGSRVATASVDGTVILWDAASGNVVGTYSKHFPIPVTCLAFSPDGRRIASASFVPNLFNKQKSEGVINVWDVQTRETVFTFRQHQGVVLSLDFSPDGKRIASSSINEDNSFVVWDAGTGAVIQVVRGHTSHVHRLRFRADGGLLASASTDGTVKLWDPATFREVRSIDAHPAPVVDVAFSPDGARFATAGQDGEVRVWETATGALALTPTGTPMALRGHTGSALSVAYSPDGRRLVSAGYDKTVRLWDAISGKEKITLRGHEDLVWSVAFSPDGQRVLSGSFDSQARIWDATPLQERTGPGLFTVAGHTDRVNSVAFSPDGRYLASGSWDRTIRLWDGLSGAELRTLEGHTGSVWSVAFSPDGTRLASASWDHTLKIWDLATGRVLRTLKGHTAPVQCVAFSPDGTRLVSGGWDGLVKVWDVETGKETATCDAFAFPTMSVAFSPDGKRLASGRGDRSVIIWDAATGKELLVLRGHKGAVPGVAFSPDGKRLVSTSWDHTMKLWDVEPERPSGAFPDRLVRTFTGHTDRVNCVAFSPDGKRIASASDDKRVRIWDVDTGEEVQPPYLHRGDVWSVAFSPDGRRVVTGCWAPAAWVKTWPAAPNGVSHP